MRKCSKFLMIFLGVVLGAALLVGLSLPEKTASPPVDSLTTSATLSTSSSIFREVTNDGLASYLQIVIPDASTSIKGIKITQTIGSVSYTLTEDEKGTACYFSDELGATKPTTFYFTRPATYTVQYILGNDTTIKSEVCVFSPTINTEVLEDLSNSHSGTGKTDIISSDSKHYFVEAGTITLPQNSQGLYTISASVNDQSVPSLLTTIPDQAFGHVTYTITSNNGNTFLTQEIVVITTDLDIEFKNNGTPLNKASHEYLGGYVFNSGVDIEVTIKSGSLNLLGSALTEDEKLEIFSHLDLKLNIDKRNATNTATIDTSVLDLDEPTAEPILNYSLPAVDHSIFTLVSRIKNATSVTSTYENGVPKIKIITKAPKNDQGNYLFAIVLGPVENLSTNNCVSGILNGYIPTGTTIYYPASAVRLFNNGYSSSSTNLLYSDGTNGTIKKGESKDFTTNGATIEIKNDTLAFNEFFTFTFDIKTYTGSNFIESMLRNKMQYNGSTIITDDFSDHENSLNFQINSFKYLVPANYETNCIPMHIRVTYNGTSFDDIYTLSGSDELEFTNYGNYTIEFYNLPNYKFLMDNLSTFASTLYYYKLDFTIAGPSILATTTNNAGKTITLSNNLYTQNSVNINVNLSAGQQFVLYKNGNETDRKDASMSFTLSDIGTWKIEIVDGEGNSIRSLSFTIADRLYQGFSINNKEEYETLIVSKLVTDPISAYVPMDESTAYHLTYAGRYRVEIDARETLNFKVNDSSTNTYTINSNILSITIQKSYFALYFSNGPSGSRTSSPVIVSGVGGVQLRSLEVYRNGKLVKTFGSDDLNDWDTVLEASRSFGDNGTYTFKLIDKFGNTYEAQMEKYYKVNVALIFLILIALAGVVVLIVTIVKARHKIKVK